MEPSNPKHDPYGLEPIEQEAAPLLTFPQKVIGIFTRPTKVFESIRQKPDVLFPYLLSMSNFAIFAFATMAVLRDYTFGTLLENYKLLGIEVPPDQLQTFVNVTMVSSVLGMIATSVIAPFVKGSFSHLISMAYSSQTTYKRSLSVVAYAYVIILLGMLIRIPLALMTKNYLFSFSPAAFLPVAAQTSALYSFLSIFDVFTLWYLVISVIGFKTVHRLPTGKAVVVVLVPFVLSTLAALVPLLTGTPLQ